MKKENLIREKTYTFALRIIKLYKYLCSKNEYVLSKQILRSGTSIGALVEESVQAESKKDFIHKMSIANKEAGETNYWIRLLRDSLYLEANEANSILVNCEEIQKIIVSIVKTSRANNK